MSDREKTAALLKLLVLSSALSLQACSTVGNEKLVDVDEAYVRRVLADGNGGKRDIVAALGQPQDKIRFDSGNEVWVFSFRKYTPKPQNFVNVGSLFGGQSNYDKELVMLFDARGAVRQWKLSSSEQDQSTGLMNQPLPKTE
ncbi:hypothetical protein CXB49_11415 [Chromobacterium sp. ATCC 53434]|uniref:hypothetical protein n=1 Tax=Chromobacterium sp. (strain ATCC 53434 / SC 14030) TaxID=2059672 RepID=UPI000C77F9DD|nr:hypothetical protein [Chromobacterium sp. ATCC 53434]AUH51380.1 hypothetical protein CXB49_11415 [Chromobacterium sp. ATCC 53434]